MKEPSELNEFGIPGGTSSAGSGAVISETSAKASGRGAVASYRRPIAASLGMVAVGEDVPGMQSTPLPDTDDAIELKTTGCSSPFFIGHAARRGWLLFRIANHWGGGEGHTAVRRPTGGGSEAESLRHGGENRRPSGVTLRDDYSFIFLQSK